MTKAQIAHELHNVRYELNWLAKREKEYNHDWRFMSTQYSKHRTRLVRVYWALKTLWAKNN